MAMYNKKWNYGGWSAGLKMAEKTNISLKNSFILLPLWVLVIIQWNTDLKSLLSFTGFCE